MSVFQNSDLQKFIKTLDLGEKIYNALLIFYNP